jgi:aquaporin Z
MHSFEKASSGINVAAFSGKPKSNFIGSLHPSLLGKIATDDALPLCKHLLMRRSYPMAKYIVEFIGAFYLFLTIAMTVLGGAGNFAPIAIGLVLMTMVYAGGHISGGHYNPAVTLSAFVRGKCAGSDLVPYFIVQSVGALLAALVAAMLLPHLGVTPATATAKPLMGIVLAEFLGTFALCYVVLNTATAVANKGNSFFGLAIGCSVLASAYALGGVSGGAFNPAVALGAAQSGMILWAQLPIYIAIQLVAGVAAGLVFKIINTNSDA